MKRIVVPLLAAVLALTVDLTPAVAKTPPGPSSLSLEPAVVDAHLGYQKQKTCSPSAKPGTKALMSLLIKTWGGSSWGISRSCNVGATSEHKEGRALDWHKDVRKSKDRKAVADAMKWLTSNNGEVAYRLGIMYIIWDQKIWSIYYQELGWRKMASRGSRTANHKDHVHISLSWDGAYQQTSWWTGQPITDPLNSRCGAPGVRACLPVIGRTTAAWPYQSTTVPASFTPAPWILPGVGGSPQQGEFETVVAKLIGLGVVPADVRFLLDDAIRSERELSWRTGIAGIVALDEQVDLAAIEWVRQRDLGRRRGRATHLEGGGDRRARVGEVDGPNADLTVRRARQRRLKLLAESDREIG